MFIVNYKANHHLHLHRHAQIMRSPHSEDLAIWMSNHPFESIWAEHLPNGRVEQISLSSFYQLHPRFSDNTNSQIDYLDRCTRSIQRQRLIRRTAHQHRSSDDAHPFDLDTDENGRIRMTKMQTMISGKQNVTLLFTDHPNESGYCTFNYITYKASRKGEQPRTFTQFIPVDFIMPHNSAWWDILRSNDKSTIENSTIRQLAKCTIGL